MIQTRSLGSRIFDACNTVFMLLITLICLYPFYYVIIYALSSPSEAIKGVTIVPRGFTLSNFEQILSDESLFKGLLVSVGRTAIGGTVTVICSSFFAYLVSRTGQRAMYGRKFIYRMVITTMYVTAGLIPTYLIYRAYGLRNNFLVYILPTAIVPYYVILLKTNFEQLPPSLEESAMLDGAGILQIFFKIILPLSKPILATIITFAVVAQWNAWFDSHIYITNKDLYSLQYILYNYLQEAQHMAEAVSDSVAGAGADIDQITPQTVRMAITAIVTIPVLFVYPFMQRYFVKGIMVGAVKG